MQCKPKRSLNVSWSSRITPSFLSKLNGIIVDEPSWTGAVLMGGWEDEKLHFCQVELQVMLFNPCRDVHQSGWDPCRCHWIIWLKWAVELSFISIAMVGKTTVCANMMGPSVYREEEGSKNWSMRNTNDQLMWFGYLSSQSNPEGPTCEVRLKWVECSSGDAQQRECGQTDLMIDSVKSSR